MGRGYAREVRRLLQQHGCTFVRQGKGDHEIWFSPITNRNIVIDVGGDNKLTANRTLKDAGIKDRL
jgi:predicted RNA binding protein YcfA (HicA-like mRNA interferase family)